MRTTLLWHGLTAACLLAGCAALPPAAHNERGEAPARYTAPVFGSDVETLLQYFAHLKRLSAAELNKEGEAAKQAFSHDRSDFNRLQFAILLGLTNANIKDEARALELLEPLAKESSTRKPGIKHFALLLQAMITDNKRLEDGLQTANQKYKDEKKTSEALQQKLDAAEQKLDALKSIEKSLIERNNPVGAKK